MSKLIEVLEDLGIRYVIGGQHHHVRTGWIGVDCPSCSPSSQSYKCGISESGFAASCWRCGKFKVRDLLLQLATVDRNVALAGCKRLWGNVAAPGQGKVARVAGKFTLPCQLRPSESPLSQAQRGYLESRNFSTDVDVLATMWNLVGSQDTFGPWAYRIFSIINHEDKPVSWTSRAIGSAGARWVSAGPEQESYPAKRLLYGADLNPSRKLILVEGPSDAWAIGPGACATLGLKFTSQQLRLLADYSAVYVCFDNEPQAQQRAREVQSSLLGVVPHVERIELDAEDPGSIEPWELRDLRHHVFGASV
jgi:hypothetical protein